ncbi:alpha/beta hydrolase family protein [Mycobacteroides abscessus subsp. abscessus]|uniref:alpha/beta hydrolase family protein n=1 Tax=Mycobacteroides abscessus TaxID=36809 RepID=UPI0009289A09|nr:alpha/beta fold hydrolase [Mycobacteroides abscessus]SIL37326.1 Putative lipase/esterase [Mycobacteroides abscessus subsp. abscessus]
MSQPERLIYGEHPSQHVDIWQSDQAVPALVFVIHGGFWREELSADLTLPIAESLSAAGFRVVNIEYRRVGGAGGWPTSFHDVRAAIESVRRKFPEPLSSFVIGHSAGGHLALLALAAGLADFAVALAPVSDIERAMSDNLGDGAAADFLGSAQVSPRVIAAASPIAQLGHSRSHVVLHGALDTHVPVGYSQHYVARARDLGTPVDYFEFSGLDHLDLIDPASVGWLAAKQWIGWQL